MAAKTTAAAGDFATGATWTGGAKPVNGDTFTINHAVDITTSEVAGTSGVNGTAMATVNAAFRILNGGTLVARGDILVGNAEFKVDQGGILEYDSSLAASPSTTSYKTRVGTANNQANSYFVTSGVAGNPAIVRSNAGGANGYFDGASAFTRGGKVKCSYTDFTRIGTSAIYAFDIDLNSNSSDQSYLDYCILDACSGIKCQSIVDGTTFRLFHTTRKNSLSLQDRFGSSDAITSGERSVKFYISDTQPQLYNPRGFTIDDCILYGKIDPTNNVWASFQRNFIRLTTGQVLGVTADVKDCYVLFDFDETNPHWVAPDADAASLTIDGFIFELAGSNGEGDCNLMPNSSSVVTHRVRNCILLPGDGSPTRNQPGTLISALGGANCSFDAENCTIFVSGDLSGTPSVTLGEGYAGRAGMMTSFRNNIVWSDGGVGLKLWADDGGSGGTMDMITAANADYNCGWQLLAGRKGKGYHIPMSGSPGTNDKDVNPQFVDSTRNMKTWDTSLGGPGTRANALAEMLKMNDRSGYNTAYSVANLRAYIRAGFTPQNPLLFRGGWNNCTIGAVQVAVVESPVKRKRLAATQRG